VLEALAQTSQPVRVHFAGAASEPGYGVELDALARKLKVDQRVEWLGEVSEEEKRRLYAQAIGIIYPPVDEDYGYVTLEAMLSSKPLITCTDSGGPLEFVRNEETGLVVEPQPEALALAMDKIWTGREQAKSWGERGRAVYEKLNITWPNVVRRLLS
jgi:glycosyltransferase involved in cell wall biosynthesis